MYHVKWLWSRPNPFSANWYIDTFTYFHNQFLPNFNIWIHSVKQGVFNWMAWILVYDNMNCNTSQRVRTCLDRIFSALWFFEFPFCRSCHWEEQNQCRVHPLQVCAPRQGKLGRFGAMPARGTESDRGKTINKYVAKDMAWSLLSAGATCQRTRDQLPWLHEHLEHPLHPWPQPMRCHQKGSLDIFGLLKSDCCDIFQ